RRVDKMLAAQAQAGSFLESPAAGPGRTTDLPSVAELPGTVIGPYKLLEQIGEGGMGTVWMAQQTAPVKRLVAVKLIKAGMDSRQRPRRPVRRQTGAEDHRLRRGQGDRATAHRQNPGYRLRQHRRHAGVHVARAGGD